MRRKHPDPLAPSIDHVIPLSKGGTNDLANLRLSHWGCNYSKRDGARDEQMRLMG